MKGKILEILKREGCFVSGEELSRQLGISRVSVWKHIQKIQQMGYGVDSGPRGYHLAQAKDLLMPWEFPGRESRIHHYRTSSSTMDVARKMAREGAPDFSVVVADTQEKGRGRLMRKWLSDDGGLYFTLILRPKLPPALSYLVNFTASMVLAETLRSRFGIEAMVKWPNDILVGGRKLSGMLSEMEAEGDMATFVNIGIGLNVNNDPTAEEPMATSLKALRGESVSRREVLAAFLDRLEERIEKHGFEDAVACWKGYTMTIGRPVTVTTTRETVEGLARDVDDSGALILEIADGSTRRVIYGDCFHRDP